MSKKKSDIKDLALDDKEIPKIPQSVELVNQTVSIPREPVKEEFLWRQLLEYRCLSKHPDLIKDFDNAVMRHKAMRAK